MDETIVQEHTFVLERAPGVGYGIAISGGKDNPGIHTGDPSIIISDVVPRGPAYDKLKQNDIVLRVNGKPMFNMEHSKAVKELKNSGQRVELTIRRKVVVHVATPPRSRSRSRDLDSPRSRYRSRSRDLDDRYRRNRSRSRDLDSGRYRDRPYRRSRSRTPPRRGRSYSRSPSYSRRRSFSRSRSSSRGYRRGRSRSPPYRRNRSRTRSRSPSRSVSSFSRSSRSISPERRYSPKRLEKHKSVEDLRSTSPLSPDPVGMKSEPGMMVFPVKKREPNTVVLKKTRWNNSYGLKLGTRIFIQDIQRGSLADKNAEITSGDTILMINGRNVDNKSVQEAIQIIGLSKDKVTMLVKKEDGGTVSLPESRFAAPASRDRPKSESERSASSRRSSTTSQESEKSEEPVPVEAPVVASKPEKKQFGGIRVLPTVNTAPPERSPSVTSSSSSSSARTSPEPAPRTSHPVSIDREYSLPPGSEKDNEPVLPPTARQITFKKERNVGIRLTGGNDVGIFVASVLDGSPAARRGLKSGDQILSVNDINFRNIIREEAILTLMGLPTGSEVRIVAQEQQQAYKSINERGTGDSFYIRTHFKYDKSASHELSFTRGATFRVFDTLYQGMVGYWLAARIGRDNKQGDKGVIPNNSRAEQLKMVQDKKIANMREHRNRGIGRRFKNQKSDAPKSSSSSAMFPAYERVVLREAGFKRPVVIFGPLADIARQRLAGDYPNLYEIARNEGVVSGQKSNRKGVIRLNTIKDVIETDKHAILDITPNAVEKLNYAQLYPIVVFLEAQFKAVVKDLRGKLATSDEERKKKPGKLYDRGVKLQRGYGHVFTDLIKLYASSDDWYRKLYSTIKDQQSMPVWVSEDKLGGAPGDDEEGVTIPGDDDQLSYVSAPASDYSVTTVGSDFLNTSRTSFEDERVPRDVTRPKPPSSSSSSEEQGEKFDDGDLDAALEESDEGPPPERPVQPPAEPEPVLEEPRERQPLTHQPRPMERYSSTSSSSEEEPAIPSHTPQVPAGRVITRVDPPRGKHEIPEGRFDPQSFLKTHIGGRKPSKDEVAPPSSSSSSSSSSSPPPAVANKPLRDEPPIARQPYRDESDFARQPYRDAAPPPVAKQPFREDPPAVAASVTPSYNPPPVVNGIDRPVSPSHGTMNSLSLVTAKPFKRPEPQQPIYSRVNKVRPSQQTAPSSQPDNRRDSTTRDYAREIDSFISAGPYKRPTPRDDLPTRHVSPPQPKPSNSYNRFAGSSQMRTDPKPYQPYSAPQPSYQRPQSSNNQPQKSKFVQENYKDYVSQMKQPPPSSSYQNSRSYNKPVSKFNNGVGSKENLYDSGVDTYDHAKPKKEPIPVSPSSLDDDDPQVVATAKGVFDSNGGVLSSVETGVSIVIPKGAIRPGMKQEIYFKVCRDNTSLPPLDKNKGETLLSPLVMCGPHGLQFDHPVELRLPHCASMTSDGWSFALKTSDPGEPSEWHNVGTPNESNNYDVGSNSVSVLIDHF